MKNSFHDIYTPFEAYDLNIYFNKDVNDTCPYVYIRDLISGYYNSFENFIPDFKNKLKINIWNYERKDCNFKHFKVTKAKDCIVLDISTRYIRYLEEEKNAGWKYALAYTFGCVFFELFEVKKRNYVFKLWTDIRKSDIFDYKETFVLDFIDIFCDSLGRNAKNILGLKQLYLMWYTFNTVKKLYSFVIYKDFTKMVNSNHLSMIFLAYDFKTGFSINRLNTSGHYVYSIETDCWILTRNFDAYR